MRTINWLVYVLLRQKVGPWALYYFLRVLLNEGGLKGKEKLPVFLLVSMITAQ